LPSSERLGKTLLGTAVELDRNPWTMRAHLRARTPSLGIIPIVRGDFEVDVDRAVDLQCGVTAQPTYVRLARRIKRDGSRRDFFSSLIPGKLLWTVHSLLSKKSLYRFASDGQGLPSWNSQIFHMMRVLFTRRSTCSNFEVFKTPSTSHEGHVL
jgi:hypothetical protein